ncbi:MAG: diaminopimelate epimerase [Candidatus Aminicenantes bacterium]|nr:diaminopimelate epimerase [Candidatus Aminicenantes bacterium]
MRVAKLHSLGNDFLIIDEEETEPISEKGALARRICDRHTGIGSNCLLLISQENKKRDIFNFRVYNADGTEAELSGNGLRCAAAYLNFTKKTKSPYILFSTKVGERECAIIKQDKNFFQIKTDMGIPKFSSKEIPFDDSSEHEQIIDYPLPIQKKIYETTLVSVGNPHCCIFVDRFPSRIEWHQIGYEIEYHPFFPKRINIEFIRVLNRQDIEVLFWERGIGETLSSGSGSCAAAVASILKNLTERIVNVKTSTGNLTVEWTDEKVYQAGPAVVVFEGDYLVH